MKAKDVLDKAKHGGYAIGAFNAANLETIKAIVNAAMSQQSPVMIEASDSEADFIGKKQLVALVRIFEQENGIPILLNLDHAQTKDSVLEAIEAGFDYVHFDGSKFPYEENVRITKELAVVAHTKGILIEGEMDAIAGSSADHTAEPAAAYQNTVPYSDAVKAQEFVSAVGVDTFAAFIGNVHGLYAGEKKINLPRLQIIRAALPTTFLSLHGGSGIPASDIKVAIGSGVVKINVNSELRVAYRDALRRILSDSQEVAIYKLMPPVITAVQKIVEEKIRLFGSAGKLRMALEDVEKNDLKRIAMVVVGNTPKEKGGWRREISASWWQRRHRQNEDRHRSQGSP